MSFQLPRKRTILFWHRWLGITSALFLVSLAITGLALNHTEFLKLDKITIKNRWLLQSYGMAGGADISAYSIHDAAKIAHLDGQLFYNTQTLGAGSLPLGIIEGDPITVIVTAEALLYLTSSGELVETVDTNQLPFNTLSAVGYSPDGRPILMTDTGNFAADADWLKFEPFSNSYSIDPLNKVTLSPSEKNALLDAFQGGGVSLYRVLLDLHSGRLFGWGGRTLMDLTAVAILILITSGIAGWLRKSRNQKTPLTR